MILISVAELPEKYVLKIKEACGVEVYTSTDSDIPKEDITVLGTYGRDVTNENLSQYPNLKWIQIFQTGFDHVDLSVVRNQGVKIANIKGVYGSPMSEFVMSYLLYDIREIDRFIENQSKKSFARNQLVGELSDKTIGIFGTGMIGQEIARKAQAFDMTVCGFNSNGRKVENFDKGFSLEKKEQMIAACDYLVLVLPETPETDHFISTAELEIMKESAILINIGRGNAVDEDALVRSLKNKVIKGAVLDVFKEEPLPETSPLWEVENLLITPHLSGKTNRFFERLSERFIEHFQQSQAGQPLTFEIDLEKGY